MPGSTAKGASKATQRSHRAGASSDNDALQILAADHKKVVELFDAFDRLKHAESDEDENKQLLVETACSDLTIHAQVEEELLYPVARNVIEDADAVDIAEVEHATIRQLVTDLCAMQPGDDLYDAKFAVLGNYVKYHIQNEEQGLFPLVKKSHLDLMELAAGIRNRKTALHRELGVEVAGIQDQEVPVQTSHRRGLR